MFGGERAKSSGPPGSGHRQNRRCPRTAISPAIAFSWAPRPGRGRPVCGAWGDLPRNRDLRGKGEQTSPARREQLLSACRGASEGTCCQRSRPGLEKCEAGDFSLSLVLARRERLRKVALAVSQKSPARPGVEGSGLPSSFSGCTAEGFSRDIPGTCPPCSRRARSVPRTAEVAREGVGAGPRRRCTALRRAELAAPEPPPDRALLSPASLQALPAAAGREDAPMAKGSSCFTAGKCERRRFGRASAVLPPRWNNADLNDQENIFPFQEDLSS